MSDILRPDDDPDEVDWAEAERGPVGADPTPPKAATAAETVFLAAGAGLVLVHKGDPIPRALADAQPVPAVFDEAGGCWNPAPPKRKRKR